MGNVAGRSAATARGSGSDWRGPFSDEEFSCLSARFKEAVAGKQRAEVEKSCQAWLEIKAPTSTPNEVSSVLKRVGAAFCRLSDRHAEGNALSERAFAETVAQCTRASSQSVLRSLFALFASPENEATLSSTETTALLLAVLCMADPSSMVEDGAGTVAAANTLTQSAIRYSGQAGQGADSSTISQDEFVRWASAQCPLLHTVFVSWMAHRSFHSLAQISFVSPSCSHKSQILSRAHFVNLSMATTALQQPLDRLYTSAQDGLSFNRLCYHMLGYSGPTLVVIQDTEGAVFGMFCDTEWKVSSRFFGGNGCFLFRAAPDFRLYCVTPSGANENYMYLNSKGYALPRGLGMGGDTNSFRLFLSEDLDENSYTTPKDLSFEQGALSSRKKFLINAMEVWGCGGEDARASQGSHRQETAELINRARKVDKAQFVGSDFDKEMFLGKTFGHGTDRGRIADDEH